MTDEELISRTTKPLRDLVNKYKQRKLSFNKQHESLDNEKEEDNFIELLFLTICIRCFYICDGYNFCNCNVYSNKTYIYREKIQTLLANLAMVRGAKAITEEIKIVDKGYWIIITWLSIILLCILFLTIEILYRMPIFRKYHYSNTIKIMIFISDIKSYVPIKLCKTSGSIHLFKLTGSINKENITLHKNTLWDIMEIDWRLVTVTLSGNVINLPGSVIIPFRDKIQN